MSDLGFQPHEEPPADVETVTARRSWSALARWELALLALLGGTIAYGADVSPYFLHSTNLFFICLNVG